MIFNDYRLCMYRHAFQKSKGQKTLIPRLENGKKKKGTKTATAIIIDLDEHRQQRQSNDKGGRKPPALCRKSEARIIEIWRPYSEVAKTLYHIDSVTYAFSPLTKGGKEKKRVKQVTRI